MRVIPRTVILKKRPTVRNLQKGTICVYQSELNEIARSEMVIVEVQDSFGNNLAATEFTVDEFLRDVRPWRKSGRIGYFRSFVK